MEQVPPNSNNTLQGLVSEDPEVRLSVISAMSTSSPESAQVSLLHLERLAVTDPDARVRLAAFNAIDDPAFRQARRRRVSGLNYYTVNAIVGEINGWLAQGLIAPEHAALLKSRYVVPADNLAPIGDTSPAAKTPKKNTSLAQALFSETSIRTFLYLGAFFVIAASVILATLVEGLRLPILFGMFALFGGGSLVIKKRLPQPSFVLFIVAAMMIPITAGVFQEKLFLSDASQYLYYVIAYLIFTGVCWWGTWSFTSRVLSLGAYAGIAVALLMASYMLSSVFGSGLYFWAPCLGVASLFGTGMVYVLRRWNRNAKMSTPLYWVSQVAQLILFGAVLVVILASTQNVTMTKINWAYLGFTLILGGIYYLLSYRVGPIKRVLPGLSVFPIGLGVFLISLSFDPSLGAMAIVLLATGGLYIALSEVSWRVKSFALPELSIGFLAGGPLLLLGSIIVGLFDLISNSNSSLFCTNSLAVAGILAASHVIRPRWYMWAGAIAVFVNGYTAFFSLPMIKSLNVMPMAIWLVLSFLFLLPDIIFRRKTIGTDWRWRAPLVGFGGMSGATTVFLAFEGHLSDNSGVLVVVCLAALLVVYAWRRNPLIGFVALASLAVYHVGTYPTLEWILALFAFAILIGLLAYRTKPVLAYATTALVAMGALATMLHQSFEQVSIGLAVLGSAYFFAGVISRRVSPSAPWATILQNSGLALSTIASFTALVEFTPMRETAFVPAVIAALLWTFKAFISNNVYLGFPANALYLMAFWSLIYTLDVREPQIYSVAAAAVGFLQYHLLIKAGKPQVSAFITGGVSMLILLGTTYYQMISTQQLQFFALLFFQSLIVMVYGIAIRSRSLFGFPILAVVIGVTTVVLFILRGLSTVIIIGGTGIIMIGIGIAAVLLREKITRLGVTLSEWKA